MRKKEGRLWQVIDGEAYLVDGEVDGSWKGRWFFPKVVNDNGIFLGNPPLPLTMANVQKIATSGGCLNTDEVVALCGCSRLTVRRPAASGGLKAMSRRKGQSKDKRRAGERKGFLFSANEVLRWKAASCITVGRPKKKTV